MFVFVLVLVPVSVIAAGAIGDVGVWRDIYFCVSSVICLFVVISRVSGRFEVNRPIAGHFCVCPNRGVGSVSADAYLACCMYCYSCVCRAVGRVFAAGGLCPGKDLAIVGIDCDITRVFLCCVSSGIYLNTSCAGQFAVRYCLDSVINIDRPACLKATIGGCLVGVGHIIGYD